jgi:hypothetical protein
MTWNKAEKILCHIGNYLSEDVYHEVQLSIVSVREYAIKLVVWTKPFSTKLDASVRPYGINLEVLTTPCVRS